MRAVTSKGNLRRAFAERSKNVRCFKVLMVLASMDTRLIILMPGSAKWTRPVKAGSRLGRNTSFICKELHNFLPLLYGHRIADHVHSHMSEVVFIDMAFAFNDKPNKLRWPYMNSENRHIVISRLVKLATID